MLVRLYIYTYKRAACLVLFAVCQRSSSKALRFGKRVQRYDLFPNWQNNSPIFFKKIEKKDKMGQKEGRFEEKWEKNTSL